MITKNKKNILIISQAKVGPTETFIQAHIDRIEGDIFHLYGYYLHYFENGISLREKFRPQITIWNKLFNFLPYYFIFRIHQKNKSTYSDFNLAKRYFLENNIQLVLAEYGTTGAFITPVCRSLGIPLVVHFHGFDASRFDILKDFKEDYLAMFEYATKIIGVSNRMIDDLKNMGCPENKLVLNTYGPNPKFFDAKPDYYSNNIIAIGSQTFKKAPYLSILAFSKALKKHPDLHLHFIGDGEIMEISKNIVTGLGLEKSIHFHGVKTPEEVIARVNQSFLFIQHSVIAANGNSEGTPVAVLEAMAAGLPVVSTKHAGITDVVIENETGFLVNECDVNRMQYFIELIAADRKLAKEMGGRAKDHIIRNYSMERHITELNQCLNSLLKS